MAEKTQLDKYKQQHNENTVCVPPRLALLALPLAGVLAGYGEPLVLMCIYIYIYTLYYIYIYVHMCIYIYIYIYVIYIYMVFVCFMYLLLYSLPVGGVLAGYLEPPCLSDRAAYIH